MQRGCLSLLFTAVVLLSALSADGLQTGLCWTDYPSVVFCVKFDPPPTSSLIPWPVYIGNWTDQLGTLPN